MRKREIGAKTGDWHTEMQDMMD